MARKERRENAGAGKQGKGNEIPSSPTVLFPRAQRQHWGWSLLEPFGDDLQASGHRQSPVTLQEIGSGGELLVQALGDQGAWATQSQTGKRGQIATPYGLDTNGPYDSPL